MILKSLKVTLILRTFVKQNFFYFNYYFIKIFLSDDNIKTIPYDKFAIILLQDLLPSMSFQYVRYK